MTKNELARITAFLCSDAIEILNKNIEDLITKLESPNVNSSKIYDHTLWDTAKVAEYIGVSHKYAGEYMVTHHLFPKQIRVENNKGSKGFPRWYAHEVIAWVAQCRAP